MGKKELGDWIHKTGGIVRSRNEPFAFTGLSFHTQEIFGKEIDMMIVSLQRRYDWSFRTRFRSYEDKSPEMFYSSVLSDGPVAFIDKIVIRAPLKILPMASSYWKFFSTKRKENPYWYGIDPAHRIQDFVVYIASSSKRQCLYLTLTVAPLHRSIFFVMIGGLVDLARIGILDFGHVKDYHLKAKELMELFSVSELELRIDMNRSTGNRLMKLLDEYRDPEGNFKLSCYKKCYERGCLIKLYDKCESVVRFEMVLYGKAFKGLAVSGILSTPEDIFFQWWPYVQKKLSDQKRFGRKPLLQHLIDTIADWTSLPHRIRFLELEVIAEDMIRAGSKKGLF